ncbi:hypothetical protein E4U32_003190 [Claviceps aff. humidiphila group G2b]|nr:hypothetical protein E4U32_003190 [Claviceps aff. humidiphila group G2b]
MTPCSPLETLKRKRFGKLDIPRAFQFSFHLMDPDTFEDGEVSPRSKMAYRFRGLALGSGDGAPHDKGNDDDDDDNTMGTKQKRLRMDSGVGQINDQDPRNHISEIPNSRRHMGSKTHAVVAGSPSSTPLSPNETKTTGIIKSSPRKKATTPPLKFNSASTWPEEKKSRPSSTTDRPKKDERDVVDPIRAALTWHEDEITMYDPNDADDDGTGVNGIGFKPTPALERSRIMRRREQMAAYRKREECEARAKRTQRRRGEEPLSARPKKGLPERRVRFVHPEGKHAVFASL